MKYLLLALPITIVALAVAPHALAQTGGISGGTSITLPNPISGAGTFSELLTKILNFLTLIGAPIASIMVIWGAFQMLFAGGDPEKFSTGRRTIVYTAIAYGIILIANGVDDIIKDVFSGGGPR